MIYEIKRYVDDEGVMVVEKIPVAVENGEVESGNPSEFFGMATLGTPQGEMPFQFPFPEDYTLEKCFENFKDVVENTIAEMQKEAQKTIVTPDNSGGIIIP